MPKTLWNEAEGYLLKNWSDAHLLEESMARVRDKYAEVFERIAESVKESHPELDAFRVAVTQFWGTGYFGFGRKSWPGGESHWPTGLWISNIRLEVLLTEESDAPYAYIEYSSKAKSELDFDAARRFLFDAAKKLLTADELKGSSTGEYGKVLIDFAAPSKRALSDALSKGDGAEFEKLMIAQFDVMARFVPAIDQVMRECVK